MIENRSRYRYVRIAIAAALMASTVFVVGRSMRSATTPAVIPLNGAGDAPPIRTESGVFERSELALDYRTAPEGTTGTRTLATFVSRRAYPGAPPIIPHPLADPTTFGGRACLECHGDGGWVQKFSAFAPVTPHPELINCVQCHVPRTVTSLMRGSTFVRAVEPPIHQAAFKGSPPAIPHDLQMRDNCLACHAGPAAVREIRVTHPERSNCRQCHALGAFRARPFSRSAAMDAKQ